MAQSSSLFGILSIANVISPTIIPGGVERKNSQTHSSVSCGTGRSIPDSALISRTSIWSLDSRNAMNSALAAADLASIAAFSAAMLALISSGI